ncbi:MAG TPA: tyrosine-type recombinase/integrase [Thermaerobacter sp.]
MTAVPDTPLPEPMEQYLESKRIERGLSHSTLAEYRRDLLDFCRWLSARRRKSLDQLGPDDLAAVDRDLARKWLAHLDERALAPATRARRLSSVGGCFKWLAAEGLIPRDPFARLERPIAGERHKRLPMYLSESEAERLLQTVLSDEGLSPRQKAHHARLKERDYALITLLLYQGLRISEAVGLRLGDLDFQDGTVRVIGKGDKERLLPLHRRSQGALQLYLRAWPGPRKPRAPQDPLWWTLSGRPLTKNAAQVAVKRHLTRAGLWRASAHKLRHTFGTRLAEAGVDLLVIKDLLGHATVATTQIYAHVAQGRLREAMERLR